MSFGPNKIEFRDVLINSTGSLIAGAIGSITILLLVFFVSGIVDIKAGFNPVNLGVQTTTIFPIILSIIALIGITTTMFLTYKMLSLTSPDRYKKNIVILGQIAFFTVFAYLFITPVYVVQGLKTYENIMYIFLFHTIIVAFGTSLIIEVLNNYRYVLLGIYGSFVGLFFSIIFTLFVFSSFSAGYAKLISLILLLPIINFLMTFFKQLFEFLYYHYHKYTNLDQLGDIFSMVEQEEKEQLKLEEEKNLI